MAYGNTDRFPIDCYDFRKGSWPPKTKLSDDISSSQTNSLVPFQIKIGDMDIYVEKLVVGVVPAIIVLLN